MRSRLSHQRSGVDWQIASAVLGIGPTCGDGGIHQIGNPAGSFAFAAKANSVARGVLAPFLLLLGSHPEASAVEVYQEFDWQGSGKDASRFVNAGLAKLITPNGKVVVESDAWPQQVEDYDWNDIDEGSLSIKFTLPRIALDLFTLDGVTAMTPLAEMVIQQHSYELTSEKALEHVRSPFGELRVERGKVPQLWGVPGLRLIDRYLKHGGNPSAMDSTGMTPLGAALYFRQAAVVRKLSEAGADIGAPAAGGLLPIDMAIVSGDVSMVRLCEELGATPNTNGYVHPIFRAVDINSSEIFKALLDMGADMDVETPDGIPLSQYIEALGGGAQFLSILTAKSVEIAIDSSTSSNVDAKRKQTFSL